MPGAGVGLPAPTTMCGTRSAPSAEVSPAALTYRGGLTTRAGRDSAGGGKEKCLGHTDHQNAKLFVCLGAQPRSRTRSRGAMRTGRYGSSGALLHT
jgi:hypothetical protein